MWAEFTEAVRAQLGNQLVAGAIAIGLIGALVAALRKVPGALWSQLQRAFVVTATIDSRNDPFPAFVAWLDDQRLGKRSRWFTVVQAPPAIAEDDTDADDVPAPGRAGGAAGGRVPCQIAFARAEPADPDRRGQPRGGGDRAARGLAAAAPGPGAARDQRSP